jgi:hypothetical protein
MALKKRPNGSLGLGNTCGSPTGVQLYSPTEPADTTASSMALWMATAAVGPLPPPVNTVPLASAEADDATPISATAAPGRDKRRASTTTHSMQGHRHFLPFPWRSTATGDTHTPRSGSGRDEYELAYVDISSQSPGVMTLTSTSGASSATWAANRCGGSLNQAPGRAQRGRRVPQWIGTTRSGRNVAAA